MAEFYSANSTCPYAVAGLGFHHDTFRVEKNDSVIVPESFVANFGVGVEYFIRWAFSLDGVVRTYYLQGRGGHVMTSQIQLGFQYYLLR